MTYERLIADSYYEEPVTLDEEPAPPWHQRPACERCESRGWIVIDRDESGRVYRDECPDCH